MQSVSLPAHLFRLSKSLADILLPSRIMISSFIALFAFVRLFTSVNAHSSIFHPSMYGFNVTEGDFPYDNRPVSPLMDMTFDQWWFHGHLDHPPNDGDVFELPAGSIATAEVACNKGATTFFASSEGGDIRDPNNPNDPCPGSGPEVYHATGPDNVKGCALAIAYKADVRDVVPEDFAVFSINQTCVWNRFTDFPVPERMPPCPEGGCTCAFFWIHSEESGGEQNYMNGFKCDVTNSTADVPIAQAKVPRRCGADEKNNRLSNSPANCTYGAKQPFYWFQKERNNMFEGDYSPPFYLDLYNFLDGAQDDIFEDSYLEIPEPSPNAVMPTLAYNLTRFIDLGVAFASQTNSSKPDANSRRSGGGLLSAARHKRKLHSRSSLWRPF